MLCPEVWAFKSPQQYQEIEQINCIKQGVPSIIKNHYFNHSVSVVLPNAKVVPQKFRDSILEDSDYYKILGVPVSQLIDKAFIEAFVKQGELTLLSVDIAIDLDNCIAITPTGHLILSLGLEDYQKLGIEGKPSYFDRKRPTRYIVTINLNEDIFTPGKKNYERVRTCFEKYLNAQFNIIVTWEPPEENLCPSSIAAWFVNHGYKASLCRAKINERLENSRRIPTVEGCKDINKIFEWIGIFSLNGDTVNGGEDNYVNTYSTPSPSTTVDNILYLEYTGFFTRSKISSIYEAVKDFVITEDTTGPWVSLHVHGFADSPVSWTLKEHTYSTDGINCCTIIFQPTGKCIIQKSLSSNNKPRIIQ